MYTSPKLPAPTTFASLKFFVACTSSSKENCLPPPWSSGGADEILTPLPHSTDADTLQYYQLAPKHTRKKNVLFSLDVALVQFTLRGRIGGGGVGAAVSTARPEPRRAPERERNGRREQGGATGGNANHDGDRQWHPGARDIESAGDQKKKKRRKEGSVNCTAPHSWVARANPETSRLGKAPIQSAAPFDLPPKSVSAATAPAFINAAAIFLQSGASIRQCS